MTPLPILMYHKVGQPVLNRQDRFLNVSANSFRRQMGMMARQGYQARTFAEVVQAMVCKQPLPKRTFVVTFDDGYQCVGDVAVPILAEFGFPATVFVPTAYVGQTNAWDHANAKPVLSLMGWEELRQLQETGWEIAGHTHTHPHLDRLSDAEALAEICEGKALIESRLGAASRTFCYPFGDINAHTPALVREAGFLGACTTQSGLASPQSDPLLLPRVKVSYSDDLFGFLYRLQIRPYLKAS